MMGTFQKILRSFGYAGRGLLRTVREERNFRVHLTAVFFVTWLSVLYGISAEQWCLLILLFSLILGLELLNTAVENAVDLITRDKHPLAEKAKDAAAGAVLVAAVGAVVIAVFLFRDPSRWATVWDKLIHPVRLPVLILLIPAALLFIRGWKREK